MRLAALVQESVDLCGGALEQTGARIAWEPAGADAAIEIEADPVQLQQALVNLLKNGAEAAGRGGTVSVEIKTVEDDRVALEITDDGPGISPEMLDRIFNPFFTTKDRGTGLGLAIVHRIVEAHGGNIRAANREQGGARFLMSLPRRQAVDVPAHWEDD